ncbi:MAG: hypothetical protein VKO21_00395 [Candidatus Sericytochromatia bacterium]|nr:hypothetical protein [Candidatus Sericytochromatia bacterium]
MQDPTLRTFTLDFFRRQGAEAAPLDTQRRRWAIRMGERRFDIAFAPGTEVEAVLPGTPRFREILAECEERGAVSHRHVVSEPISDPASLLLGIAPEGWVISRVRLDRVRSRRVVAFTHRVAYGAGVLPHPVEETHVDILDPVTGMASPALVDALSGLQVLPADPPRDLPPLGPLHARAVALVDARTGVRGEALERQLQARRTESVARIRRHYGVLREEARQREIRTLEERLATVLGAIRGALPADLTDLSREGSELARRLDDARKGQTVALASLARLEEEAVRAEEAAHEVTLTTELVALHVVTYDEVAYAVRFGRPGGFERSQGSESAEILVGYVPVTRQILLPDCGVCGEVVADPVMAGAELACRTCVRSCGSCDRPWPDDGVPGQVCTACGIEACPACRGACTDCETVVCARHRESCGTCGRATCQGCAAACAADGETVCHGCRLEAGGVLVCPAHGVACGRCETVIQVVDALASKMAGETLCASCAGTCGSCGAVFPLEVLLEGPEGPLCPEHAGTCRTCFDVVSSGELSGCGVCGRMQCGRHLAACAGCGLMMCPECSGEGAGCLLCGQLALAAPQDPRLQGLEQEFGLPRVRAWLVAERQGARVVEWQGAMGRWGRLAWDREGKRVTDFRYGPITAMVQEVLARIRPA